jgi:hypothetical protein
MAFFIILSPFIVTASLLAFTTAVNSLFAGCATALALVTFDVWRGRQVKVLAAGSAVVFAALGVHQSLIDREWSDFSIRLAIDIGMLAIALVSIAVRLPFTLQYAREQVDAETTAEPEFLRVNYILSWAWVAAMVLMLIADILMIYFPALPLWSGVVAIYLARNAAVYFTKWYSNRWIEKARESGLKA